MSLEIHFNTFNVSGDLNPSPISVHSNTWRGVISFNSKSVFILTEALNPGTSSSVYIVCVFSGFTFPVLCHLHTVWWVL